jgi:hypothetical protein
MSLRTFHLLFIVLSIVLAVFMAAWAVDQYRVRHEAGYAAAGLAAVAAAGMLGVYAAAFRRKTRHL